MLHQNIPIGFIHVAHNWEYADSAARLAATGFVSGDLKKLALQLDTNALYILTATTPTWVPVNSGSPTLASLGAIFNARSAKTANYTALLADKGILIDATSGTWTLSLTAAATLGSAWVLGVFNSGTGLITIDPNSTETIRDYIGSSTTATLAQGEGGIIFCDGTNFFLFRFGPQDIVPANVQAGNYTFVMADRFRPTHMTSGSANAATVPPNSSVAYPIGSILRGWTLGAGVTTITPGAAVTINSRGAVFASAGQYASWMLEKQATDVWLLTGDLV